MQYLMFSLSSSFWATTPEASLTAIVRTLLSDEYIAINIGMTIIIANNIGTSSVPMMKDFFFTLVEYSLPIMIPILLIVLKF